MDTSGARTVYLYHRSIGFRPSLSRIPVLIYVSCLFHGLVYAFCDCGDVYKLNYRYYMRGCGVLGLGSRGALFSLSSYLCRETAETHRGSQQFKMALVVLIFYFFPTLRQPSWFSSIRMGNQL